MKLEIDSPCSSRMRKKIEESLGQSRIDFAMIAFGTIWNKFTWLESRDLEKMMTRENFSFSQPRTTTAATAAAEKPDLCGRNLLFPDSD